MLGAVPKRDVPNTPKDSKMPVVVFVHGGPESQSRPNFNPVVQYLVHRGYGVLVPNVRGSTGYGNAYEHLDDVEKRMDAVKDLKYAQQWLVKSGYSRPKRIAVMGGSYGGFMTAWAVTQTQRFKAAMAALTTHAPDQNRMFRITRLRTAPCRLK